MRPLLPLLVVCAARAAAAASPAAAAAVKFDKKVDKSLLSNDRLWPEGFLRTEFIFPPVREEMDSSSEGIEVDRLAPPPKATVRFPSARPTARPSRFRRAAGMRRSEFDEVDSFLRSSTKSKPQRLDDDLSDDAFWREIEKKAMEDIAESKKKSSSSSSSDSFSDDAAAGKELAALSESIDGPTLRGEKRPLPSSSFDDTHFVGTTAPSVLSQESITPTAIAAAGMVGTKFTDWNDNTKDDFEAWLRSKGEAIPQDLFETTTAPPAPPPPEIPPTTTPRSGPVQTTATIEPIAVEPWNAAPVPDSFTAVPSIQEPWTEPPTTPQAPAQTSTESWTPPAITPAFWQTDNAPTSAPPTPPDIVVQPMDSHHSAPLAPTVALPATVVHVDTGVDPDFPMLPPRARGLHNVPAGHNLNRQIDWDFVRGFRVINKWGRSLYPDVVPGPPPTSEITVQTVTVDQQPPTSAEPPQPAYTASYGRKDAEVVAALIEGLLPGTPGKTTVAPTVSFSQSAPSYSVEGKLPPGYVAVPASWLDRLQDGGKGATLVGRSQYETFPEPQQQQQPDWQRPVQQLQQPSNWQQQPQQQPIQWNRPTQQQPQFGALPSFVADNSALTGRTFIGTTITDPNVYFPEANGALYLGAPQTVFYARPRQLPREPLIVGNTPDWALGPQRLFKWDPRTPAATWYGQSLAPLVPGAQRPYPVQYAQYASQGSIPQGYGSQSGYGSQPYYASSDDSARRWGR